MNKVASLAFGLVIALPVSAMGATYLTKADFETKIVGKTLASKTKKGKAFTSSFASGGKGSMKINGIKASTITWSFSGDTLCWEAYKTKECDKIEMSGAGKANFVDASSGKVNNSYTVK